MGKAQRDKGKRGEYEVRDILKRITGVEWMRTPLSGGYHLDFPWDIFPRKEYDGVLSKVGIEAKNTATILMPAWIEQCEEAEQDYLGFQKGEWLLFFKHKAKWYFSGPVEELERLLKP